MLIYSTFDQVLGGLTERNCFQLPNKSDQLCLLRLETMLGGIAAPRKGDRMARTAPARKNKNFDPRTFLATIGDGRKVVLVPKKQSIFSQGDAADAVFYIQMGKSDLVWYPRLARKQL